MNTGTPFEQQVAEVGCAALVDAMGRLYGHRAHLLPMTSPSPDRAVAGRAVTMLYLPWREDLGTRGFAAVLDEALQEGNPEPRVLVLSSGGYPDVSHGGGIKLARAEGKVAGIVCDGRLRDFDQLRTYRSAIWCRGEAVRWGGDVVAPHAANVPVELGGACVASGDYIFMDATGGVVIPYQQLGRVIEMARAVNSEDAASLAAIRQATGPCGPR